MSNEKVSPSDTPEVELPIAEAARLQGDDRESKNRRVDEYGQVWVKAHNPETNSNGEFPAALFDDPNGGRKARGWKEGHVDGKVKHA